jgi:hypothetical protein
VANTWYLGVGPGADQPTEQALQILNVDGADAVVTVQAITPSGIVTVPSLESVPLGGYATITVDLTDPAALGRALIVRSTSRVFVERVLPREAGAVGRVASWLLPAN